MLDTEDTKVKSFNQMYTSNKLDFKGRQPHEYAQHWWVNLIHFIHTKRTGVRKSGYQLVLDDGIPLHVPYAWFWCF